MSQVYYVQNEPVPVLEAGNNWRIKECHDLTLPGERLHVKQALHCTNLYRIIYMCPGVLSLKNPPLQAGTDVPGELTPDWILPKSSLQNISVPLIVEIP